MIATIENNSSDDASLLYGVVLGYVTIVRVHTLFQLPTLGLNQTQKITALLTPTFTELQQSHIAEKKVSSERHSVEPHFI